MQAVLVAQLRKANRRITVQRMQAFEGVKGLLGGAGAKQNGAVDFIVKESDGTVTEFRVQGALSYDYDPNDVTGSPWRVFFKDQRGNEVTLEAAPLGGAPEDKGANLPTLLRLHFQRALADANLKIRVRTWPWFGEREVAATGRSSLESARMRG